MIVRPAGSSNQLAGRFPAASIPLMAGSPWATAEVQVVAVELCGVLSVAQ